MNRITIEVEDSLQQKIKQNAKVLNISDEDFIIKILSRFVIDSHIMDSKEVKDAYQECGNLNLELANG